MRYTTVPQPGDKHIGDLVRFASIITAYARANLFNALWELNRLTETDVTQCAYIDTDSVHMDMSGGFTLE